MKQRTIGRPQRDWMCSYVSWTPSRLIWRACRFAFARAVAQLPPGTVTAAFWDVVNAARVVEPPGGGRPAPQPQSPEDPYANLCPRLRTRWPFNHLPQFRQG